jgi:hypothetical protein
MDAQSDRKENDCGPDGEFDDWGDAAMASSRHRGQEVETRGFSKDNNLVKVILKRHWNLCMSG